MIGLPTLGALGGGGESGNSDLGSVAARSRHGPCVLLPRVPELEVLDHCCELTLLLSIFVTYNAVHH